MDHKWGRTCADLFGSWPPMTGQTFVPIPATLASRVLTGIGAGGYLLNWKTSSGAGFMYLLADMQTWQVALLPCDTVHHPHFPYGVDVEPDGPV